MLIMILSTAIFANDTVVHLEFKETHATIPGRVGSVQRQDVWIGDGKIRVDFGAETSKLIDLETNRERVLDHLTKTYSDASADPADDLSIRFSKSSPPAQFWNKLDCHVYVYQQSEVENPYEISIWFSDILATGYSNLLSDLAGLDANAAFEGGPPKGFPVRVLVRVQLDGSMRDAMELRLVEQEETEPADRLFNVPSDYISANIAPQ